MNAADPPDDAIEAMLLGAPDAAWRELADAVRAVEAETVYATWRGGEPVVTTVDRVERVARQAPYPEYTEPVERLRSALGGVRASVVFGWMDWDGLHRYRTPDDVAAGSAADAVRLVTAILRAERFGDGSIEAALRSGLLTAAAGRLLRWHAER